MQIVLIVDSTEYVLAHGADRAVDQHVGPDDTFSHDCGGLVQIDSIIGAAYRKIHDRQNLLSSINFGVQVQKASPEEALRYKTMYPVTLPRHGVLEIRPDTGDLVRFATAQIERVSCQPIGTMVSIRYQISAATPSLVTP